MASATDMAEMTSSPDDGRLGLNASGFYDQYYDYDYDAGELRFYYVLWTIATPIVFALITVVGVIGNLFVVMVIVVMVIMTRSSRRQSPTNILLLNLACADFQTDIKTRASAFILTRGPLSLAVPPWASAMSTGDGPGHRWGRNGEFCVIAVGPVTSTAGVHKSVKGAGC